MPPKPLIAGNWKMNGLTADVREIGTLAQALKDGAGCDVAVFPPLTLAAAAREKAGGLLWIGAQDCHTKESGAHTGDISAAMLADMGLQGVIVGHSERRQDHGERDSDVRLKALAAHRAGLCAIICVGETRAEREAGQAEAVVLGQLAASVPESAVPGNTVIAYEPVWAIGTGLTPTQDDIAAMHGTLRRALTDRFGPTAADMRLLYGGSVKPANAAEILPITDVDGALVGGASLRAEDFLGIIRAYDQAD